MSGSITGHPLLQLLSARLREFVRTPEAVFWVYVFPLVMVVALGLAFRSEPIETISVDLEEGAKAEAMRSALTADPRFKVAIRSKEECEHRLRVGKVDLVVGATAEAPATGESTAAANMRYMFDPTRPGSVLARAATDDVLQRDAGRADVFSSTDSKITEPGSRYIDFLVPGLIGMGLMGGGLWGVGFAIVDMRIRRLLKRFLATPMKKGHFLGAMMLSRLVFMLPEIIVLLVFAWLFFGVVNRGSYLIVILLVVIGAFEFAGIGLLVASRAKTLEAVSGWMNLVMIPMWIGSGIFFSPTRFPDAAQPFLKALPLTPLINALRQVMLEGATLMTILPEIGMILGWGVVTFLVALRMFRWE